LKGLVFRDSALFDQNIAKEFIFVDWSMFGLSAENLVSLQTQAVLPLLWGDQATCENCLLKLGGHVRGFRWDYVPYYSQTEAEWELETGKGT
jgi:hypothetical protein